MNDGITRREALRKSLALASASIGASLLMPALFTGCQKSCQSPTLPKEKNEEENLPEVCPEPYELTADDKQARAALRYVDKTPIEGRTCDNCKLYTLPKPKEVCGGCSILKGPIHPKGYCMSWFRQM